MRQLVVVVLIGMVAVSSGCSKNPAAGGHGQIGFEFTVQSAEAVGSQTALTGKVKTGTVKAGVPAVLNGKSGTKNVVIENIVTPDAPALFEIGEGKEATLHVSGISPQDAASGDRVTGNSPVGASPAERRRAHGDPSQR